MNMRPTYFARRSLRNISHAASFAQKVWFMRFGRLSKHHVNHVSSCKSCKNDACKSVLHRIYMILQDEQDFLCKAHAAKKNLTGCNGSLICSAMRVGLNRNILRVYIQEAL